jgi:hypothetical protein
MDELESSDTGRLDELFDHTGCPHGVLSIERKMNAEQKFTGL